MNQKTRMLTHPEAEIAAISSLREATLLHLALNSVINGECTSVGTKGRFSLQLCELASPAGGIAIVTFSSKGQRPQTTVAHLDELIARPRVSGSQNDEDLRHLIEHAVKARCKRFHSRSQAS